MDLLFKELELADMICESVESSALNQIYIESSIGDLAKEAGRNVKAAIEKIIKAFKDFIENLKKKVDYAKIMYRLKKLQNVSLKGIHVKIHDRECINALKEVYKLQMEMNAATIKLHDKFMSRKIDEDEFNEKMAAMSEKCEYEISLIMEKYENTKLLDTTGGKESEYTSNEIIKRTEAVLEYQQKITDKIKAEHDSMLEKLSAEAEKAERDAKKGVFETVKEKASDAVCRVKTKIAALISKIDRKVVVIVTSIGSVLAALRFLDTLDKKTSGKAKTESTDTFFDDIFDDPMDFEESGSLDEDDDSDIQAFNEAVDEIYEDMFGESSSKYDESYDFGSSDFDELFDI